MLAQLVAPKPRLSCYQYQIGALVAVCQLWSMWSHPVCSRILDCKFVHPSKRERTESRRIPTNPLHVPLLKAVVQNRLGGCLHSGKCDFREANFILKVPMEHAAEDQCCTELAYVVKVQKCTMWCVQCTKQASIATISYTTSYKLLLSRCAIIEHICVNPLCGRRCM